MGAGESNGSYSQFSLPLFVTLCTRHVYRCVCCHTLGMTHDSLLVKAYKIMYILYQVRGVLISI